MNVLSIRLAVEYPGFVVLAFMKLKCLGFSTFTGYNFLKCKCLVLQVCLYCY